MKPDRICQHLERVNPRFKDPEFTLTPGTLRKLVELVYREALKDVDLPDAFKDLFGGFRES